MKTVDTKGLKCPKPLIMLKEALQEISVGESLTIITDNETSLKNLITFLKDHGAEAEIKTAGSVHTIITIRSDSNLTDTAPELYFETSLPNHDYVVCIQNNLMGSGDPELGKVLIESFLENLKLQENLPTHVVLLNAGVKLAMKQSPVCSALSELEELGTRIMLCGTCIDHYGLQYDIAVGMISNMVVITETLAATGHVIYP